MSRTDKQQLNLMFFYRQDRAGKKTNKSPLQCRIKIGTDQKDMPTDIHIAPEQWDTEKKILKENCQDYETLKKDIENVSEILRAYFIILSLELGTVSPEMLRNKFNGKAIDYDAKKGNPELQTILNILDEKITDFANEVKAAREREAKGEPAKKGKKGCSRYTLTQWKTTRNKMIEYLMYLKTGNIIITDPKIQKTAEEKEDYIKEGKAYDIPVTSITPAFSEDFLCYLMETRHEPIGIGAASKQVKNTKHVLKMAVKKKWLTVNPLEDFISAYEAIDVIPLEYWQVDILYEKKGLIERIERVRDGYIAQIFTGFAWQDIRALTPEHIIQDEIGDYYLCKKRGKTSEYEVVPILPPVAALIEKYKDDPYCKKRGVLFPIIANTNCNAYLKELAALCGIQRDLNTHLARHTFAHIMLNYGVPLEVVSKMLGHKSIRTSQRYCKVSLQLIRDKVKPVLTKMFTKCGKLKVILRGAMFKPAEFHTEYKAAI
ncbi:site-specific integrase [Chitinophaga sp. CF418]|uniref:site-specific integrase n=1 Tax=Chitinophaga sp. CF418 TaxID=1855287 RepID=UPI000921F148|nr:site-specific integrase [Chitinophaga sp. CF418]SHN45397.1 Phage integrase family protein [Chitinophaga sp. CF418]